MTLFDDPEGFLKKNRVEVLGLTSKNQVLDILDKTLRICEVKKDNRVRYATLALDQTATVYKLKVVDDAPHSMYWESADIYNAAIEWLADQLIAKKRR